MQQPVQDGEVLEEMLLEDGLEVELHIALPADVGAVAQEPQDFPVGDQTPQGLGAVEELLYEGMGGQPRSTARSEAPKLLSHADYVHRRRVLRFASPMGDSEGHPADDVSTSVVAQFVAEQPEERDDPGIARDRRSEIRLGKTFEPMLEHPP